MAPSFGEIRTSFAFLCPSSSIIRPVALSHFDTRRHTLSLRVTAAGVAVVVEVFVVTKLAVSTVSPILCDGPPFGVPVFAFDLRFLAMMILVERLYDDGMWNAKNIGNKSVDLPVRGGGEADGSRRVAMSRPPRVGG